MGRARCRRALRDARLDRARPMIAAGMIVYTAAVAILAWLFAALLGLWR
jgi:hypothetical protein